LRGKTLPVGRVRCIVASAENDFMDAHVGQSGLITEGLGTVAFQNGGKMVQAFVRHLARHEVSFELVTLDAAVRTSEVLPDFSVKLGDQVVYAGRAIVTAITSLGARAVCSAALESGWIELSRQAIDPAAMSGAFDEFLDQWHKSYHVPAEFKVVVADMQFLLADLELWLAQFELELDARSGRDLDGFRIERARSLSGCTTSTLNVLFEKFETTAQLAGREQRPACRIFARRQLHPLLLCAPFLHRTYRKPLGYAGDYEMVNMISREPFEGASLFAKLVNVWFLAQPPAGAHRNRLKYLERRITEIAARIGRPGRPAKILSLGCGPAVEVQEFLRKGLCVDRVEFTLVDFNQETLERTRQCIQRVNPPAPTSVPVEFVRKSVMTILREAQGPADEVTRGQFDFVYCAGLYDYLTDPVCRRLSSLMYDWVRPGGCFLSTNVHDSNPWPLVMDYVMDWHLIYRSSAQMLATRPEQVSPGDCVLTTDPTGVNIFLEALKPEPQHRGIL
jgi:extracellular factor (EF) 3-hydroxypalmitic acid methyl ester biosynthesis protein